MSLLPVCAKPAGGGAKCFSFHPTRAVFCQGGILVLFGSATPEMSAKTDARVAFVSVLSDPRKPVMPVVRRRADCDTEQASA
jgi:hypothetical protein